MTVKSASPVVETSRDFITIKIPRGLFWDPKEVDPVSELEKGLKESFEEARHRKIHGPFKNAKSFLHALNKPSS